MDSKQEQGYEMLLMIDANEGTDKDGSKIQEFIEINSLRDIHAEFVSQMPITMRIGSHRRIDYMLATDGINNIVREAGYHALHEGIVSDHVMLWAEFAFKYFL